MNLKNILAENMLRFGVKNLSNKDMYRISTLIEQTVSNSTPKTYEEFAALDSPDVSATPGYAELFKRVFELQAGKGSGYNNSVNQATETIGWWTNSPQINQQQSNTKNTTDNVIKNINAAINALQLVKSGKLNIELQDIDQRLTLLKQAKSKLDNLISKQIYVTNWNRNIGGDKIYPLSLQTYAWDDATVIRTKIPGANELIKFIDNIDGESAPGKQIYPKQTFSAIPNDIKIKLVQESIKKAQRAGDSISKADRIFIGPKNTAALYAKTTVTNPSAEIAPVALPIAYPPKDPNLPALQNFFGDDQYQVSSEQQAAFANMLQQAAQYCKTQGTILEVQYKAGSSTSKVPTGFPGGNKALTDKRLQSLETVLASTISNNADLQGIKVTKLNPERKVEVGPNYDREKYSLDKRKANPSVKTEYDKIYGPHRGSYGEFVIIYQPNPERPTDPETSIEYIPVGNWAIKVDWHKIRIPSITIPKFGKMPTQKPFDPRKARTMDCWNG